MDSIDGLGNKLETGKGLIGLTHLHPALCPPLHILLPPCVSTNSILRNTASAEKFQTVFFIKCENALSFRAGRI